MMTILAGDVGGAKTDLCLYAQPPGRGLEPLRKVTFVSGDFESLSDLLSTFLADDSTATPPAAAALGVPGPVVGEAVRLTNLPWVIEPEAVRRNTGIERIRILNDLAVTAVGEIGVVGNDPTCRYAVDLFLRLAE